MATLVDQIVSGVGSVSLGMLARVDHVSCTVTVRGGLVREPDTGASDHIIRAGWIALGCELDSDGAQPHTIYWSPQRWLDFDHCYFPLLPGEHASTDIKWFMSPGTQVRLFVGGSAAPLPSANSYLQPWDRNPAPVLQGGPVSAAGGGSLTQAWTYTVPAGRILRVTELHASIERFSAASGLNGPRCYVTINGGGAADVYLFSNTVATFVTEVMEGGPLDLPPGTVLAGNYQNPDVGGLVYFWPIVRGYLFDA